MSKKFLLVTLLLGAFLLVGATAQAATSSLTAVQTVANIAKGTDDQSATLASTTPNETAVQSVDDVTITNAIVMGSSTTLIIDGCTISFTPSADDLDCTGGSPTGIINTSTTTTAALQATTLAKMTFTNYTAVGSTTAVVRFTHSTTATDGNLAVTGTEASGSTTVAVVTVGNAAVAEVDDIPILGTVDAGDVFGLTSTSTTLTASSTYTVVAGDTLQLIADKIRNQIWAEAASSTVGFTVATTGTATLRLTAREVGRGNTAAGTATNYAGVAQQITFTPASVTTGETFTISINSRDYSYTALSGATVASVVAGLASAASADPVATCVDTTSTTVTCTAKTAGTAFTSFSATVSNAPVVGNGSSGGSSGTAVYIAPIKKIPAVAAPTVLTRAWSYGKTGKEVKLLQEKLKALGLIKKTQKTTTYFGLITKNALIKFQKTNKIKPYNGVLNVKTRALLNSL
ncbi:MAG: peptidoglycan-binding domain-containing protein [Candidatus Paceibacterota bacterium]|jgi:LysM repeat protein